MQLQCQIPKEIRKCWGDGVQAGGREWMVFDYLLSAKKFVVLEAVEGCLIWWVENRAITKLNLWEQLSFWTPPQAAIDL